MNKTVSSFYNNLGLLLSGSIMVFSGLLIQINYHMGNHGIIDINNKVLEISYIGWSYIHKISIVLISLFTALHIILHWKWYKIIIKKKLIARNIQVLTLSTVFILVAVTGYIPWFIKITGGDNTIRKSFIEIHDKLALLLFVYLILHVTKKLKWFITTFGKLKPFAGIQL